MSKAAKIILEALGFCYLLFSFLAFRRLRFDFSSEDLGDFLILFATYLAARVVFRYSLKGQRSVVGRLTTAYALSYLSATTVLVIGGLTLMEMSFNEVLHSDLMLAGLLFSTWFTFREYLWPNRKRNLKQFQLFATGALFLFLAYIYLLLSGVEELSQNDINLYYLFDFLVLLAAAFGLFYLVKKFRIWLSSITTNSKYLSLLITLFTGNLLLLTAGHLLYKAFRVVTYDQYFHAELPDFNFGLVSIGTTLIIILEHLLNDNPAPQEDNVEGASQSNSHLLSRVNGKVVKLPEAEIRGAYISDKIVRVCMEAGVSHPIDHSLDWLANQLPNDHFFRVNRSAIIHKDTVVAYQSLPNRTLKLELNLPSLQEKQLTVSRYNSPKFKAWFKS